jgi:hypothetical protein
VSGCTTPFCRGVMVSEPDDPYPVCQLCARNGHDAEAQQRAAACGRDGCLRDAIYGKNLCQYHQSAISRDAAGWKRAGTRFGEVSTGD